MLHPRASGLSVQKALLFVLILLSLMLATAVDAQVVVDNIVDNSMNRYRLRFQYFIDNVGTRLLYTFWALALIEFSWAMIKVMIRNGGLQDFLSTAITRLMFISFFAWLLNRGSATAVEIFASFTDLAIATTITNGVVSPSNIMDAGQDIWSRMYQQAASIGVWDIIFDDNVGLSTPVLLVFAGMLALIIMGVLAAHYAVVLLETFFTASGGLIMLALGSSRWTYQYAVNYLKFALAVGMKLFVFTIIMGLTIDEIDRFLAVAAIDEINNIFALIAFLLFSCIVAIIVPKSVKGMMEGVSVGTANIGAVNDNRRTVSRTTGQVNKMIIPR